MKKMFLVAAAFFMIFAGASAGSIAHAAEAPSLGFVNVDAAIRACPELLSVKAQIERIDKVLTESYQKKFDRESVKMSDEEKEKLLRSLNEELTREANERRQNLMQPIFQKVQRAVKQAADEKGIKQVVKFDVMLYGGVDLTKDVIAIVKGA